MRTLSLLAIVAVAPACTSAPPTALIRNPSRFVFLAVLEGLYEDGVDPRAAAALLRPGPGPGHFVDKCPLCEPVRFAFEVYAAHPGPRMFDFREEPLPDALRDGLKSPERPRRLAALRDLVDRHVARRLDRSALTDAERQAFRAWALDARKQGMTMKRDDFGDYCPSCDGGNCLKK